MFYFGESVYWTYKMCSPESEPLPLLIDEKRAIRTSTWDAVGKDQLNRMK